MKKGLIWILFSILFLGALPGNAQYLKAVKGDVVPYSQAVITARKTFELETRRIKLLEENIKGQDNLIRSLEGQLKVADNQLQVADETNQHLSLALDAREEQVKQLNKQLERSLKQVKRSGRWYNKKSIWFVLGAGIAILSLK